MAEPASRVGEAHSALVLAAADEQATGAQTIREVHEDRFECLARPIAVKVVRLDIRDDLNRRRVVEEGAVGFVGLGDEDVARAQEIGRAHV